jgi:putative acetyltransferase
MKSADAAAALTIAAESPYQPEVMQLIERLDEYLIGLYPPESNHLLDIETLCQPDVRFFVARIAGEAVGCGALRLYEPGGGEIKRMFVSPRARGRRVGRALLERLEQEAVALGIRMLRLETGMHQAEAIGLYRKAGYTECEPFGDYRPDSLSLFLEKHLP